MSIFSKLRDIAYDVVHREGDFTLQFFADFFRGTEKKQANKKGSQQQSKHSRQEEPLSYDERLFFDEMLKRKQGEEQIAYWKRRKALLNMSNKKRFVRETMEAQKQQEKLNSKNGKVEVEREHRKRQIQMQRLKIAKYDAIEKQETVGMNR